MQEIGRLTDKELEYSRCIRPNSNRSRIVHPAHGRFRKPVATFRGDLYAADRSGFCTGNENISWP
jgi:hypothetical protein